MGIIKMVKYAARATPSRLGMWAATKIGEAAVTRIGKAITGKSGKRAATVQARRAAGQKTDSAYNGQNQKVAVRNEYDCPGFDDRLLLAQKYSKPIKVTLGRHIKYNPLVDYIAAMNKKARFICQHAFKMKGVMDTRMYGMEVYRHRLSRDGTVNKLESPQPDKSYPSDVKILDATADTNGSSTGIAKGPMKTMSANQVAWSRMNICDLEDMSFNLLRGNPHMLKLAVTDAVVGGNTRPSTAFATGYHPGYSNTSAVNHCRESYMTWWNRGNVASGTDNDTYEHPPQYHVVITSGGVKYDFANKANTPAKVEVIVYKVKQNHQLSPYITNHSGDNLTRCMDDLVSAKKTAYKEFVKGVASTDMMGGRAVTVADIVTNPAVKFLPTLKTEVGAEQPYVEKHRQGVIIAAGDHREIEIDFGGETYNPKDVESNKDALIPVAGQEAFFIVINCHGLSATHFSNVSGSTAITGAPYLNSFQNFDIQCVATYTENLQAARIKNDETRHVYNLGTLDDKTWTTSAVSTTATILREEAAVISTSGRHHHVVTAG